jgi:outer membrane biosynthesis protein TonB
MAFALVSGIASVVADAQNAATKAFQKALYDSIGHQSYARMEAHRGELKPGTTRVTLVITRDGAVRQLKVLSNTSSERVAMLVVDAIKHSKIPQPPPEALKNDVFERDMKFTVYPKRPNKSLEPTADRLKN